MKYDEVQSFLERLCSECPPNPMAGSSPIIKEVNDGQHKILELEFGFSAFMNPSGVQCWDRGKMVLYFEAEEFIGGYAFNVDADCAASPIVAPQ